jgi:hypothetical protein
MNHPLVTDGSLAPNLLGLHPYDAARRCLEWGLQLHVENRELVWSYGSHGQPWRVTEQLPRPGQRMSSPTIALRVSLRGRRGGVGVREPRRPRPPDRPLGAEGHRHLHASWRTAVLAEDNGTGNVELTP